MWDSFIKALSNGRSISGPLLKEKILIFAMNLGISDDFKSYSGWMTRFRLRHSIRLISVCGESASV